MPPNHLGSGGSSGGAPPRCMVEVSSGGTVCIGSTVVCIVMTAVMRGSLEVAVLLRVLDRVGINSASFPNLFSLFSSSSVGTLISMLSGFFSLFSSSSSLSFPSSIGPQVLGSVTSLSGISRQKSSVGSL